MTMTEAEMRSYWIKELGLSLPTKQLKKLKDHITTDSNKTCANKNQPTKEKK
jgi:hypothetical protein